MLLAASVKRSNGLCAGALLGGFFVMRSTYHRFQMATMLKCPQTRTIAHPNYRAIPPVNTRMGTVGSGRVPASVVVG
jgi:hypothetical protein